MFNSCIAQTQQRQTTLPSFRQHKEKPIFFLYMYFKPRSTNKLLFLHTNYCAKKICSLYSALRKHWKWINISNNFDTVPVVLKRKNIKVGRSIRWLQKWSCVHRTCASKGSFGTTLNCAHKNWCMD